MTVTFKKKQGETTLKNKQEKTVDELELDEAVDRYVELEAQIIKIKDKLAPLVAEQSKLASTFIDTGDEYFPDEKVTLDGYEHRVELSPKANSTIQTVDNEEMVSVIGEETFMALAKFGVTDLRKALTKTQLDKITVTEPTGKRKIKIVI